MATLHLDEHWPEIEPLHSLTGWRREFCVELLGDAAAKVFVRAVPASSQKAEELKKAVLFHRVDARFGDLRGFVEFARPALEQLAVSAVRHTPDKDNLFTAVAYDTSAWERLVQALERWQRQPRKPSRGQAAAG